MSSVAVAVPRVATRVRTADVLLFASFFCVTFEKVRWNVAGDRKSVV